MTEDLWSVESSLSDEDIERRFEGFDEDTAFLRSELRGTRLAALDPPAVSAARLSRLEGRGELGAVLAGCLGRMRSARGRECVAGALSSPYGTIATAQALLAVFPLPDHRARWRIGEAIDRMAGPMLEPCVDQIVEYLRGREHGKGREMLATALPRIKTDRAIAAAIDLVGVDPETDGHLMLGLRKARVEVPEQVLERLAGDSRAWVRKEVARIRARESRT